MKQRTRSTGAALGVADVPDWLYEHVQPTIRETRTLPPDVQLRLAVIISAVDDLDRYRDRPGPKALCLWGHSVAWIRFPDDALPGLLTFRDCADSLGIDVQWAQAKILGAYGRRTIADRPQIIFCEHSGAGPGESRVCPIARIGTGRHADPHNLLGLAGRASQAA